MAMLFVEVPITPPPPPTLDFDDSMAFIHTLEPFSLWRTKTGHTPSLFLHIRGLLEKYPTFGREKETGLPGALDT